MRGANALILAGIVAILGGVVALIFPTPASMTLTVLVGWLLMLSSIIGLYAAYSWREMPSRGQTIFFSILELVAGVWMVADPLTGMISLTIVIGALLAASGLVRLFVAGAFRGTPLFWPMAISGLVSGGLGLLVLFTLDASSQVLLGYLFALELLLIGAMLLALGLSMRNMMRF